MFLHTTTTSQITINSTSDAPRASSRHRPGDGKGGATHWCIPAWSLCHPAACKTPPHHHLPPPPPQLFYCNHLPTYLLTQLHTRESNPLSSNKTLASSAEYCAPVKSLSTTTQVAYSLSRPQSAPPRLRNL